MRDIAKLAFDNGLTIKELFLEAWMVVHNGIDPTNAEEEDIERDRKAYISSMGRNWPDYVDDYLRVLDMLEKEALARAGPQLSFSNFP